MHKGVFCIFLSTNMMLGNQKAYYAIDSDYAPTDAYSAQKAEAEQKLKTFDVEGKRLVILRLTKVLDKSSPILTD